MQAESLVELASVRGLVRTGAARAIRQNAGLSLGEVAGTIGVSAGTILRWETQTRVPHGEAAVAYGRLLRSLVAQQVPRSRSLARTTAP